MILMFIMRRLCRKCTRKSHLKLIDVYLSDIIKETGKLVFAGGGALNVKLNQKILDLPYVEELFVQPAASDAGTAVGAASYATWKRGIKPQKMEHVYLGPSYSSQECIEACENHPETSTIYPAGQCHHQSS